MAGVSLELFESSALWPVKQPDKTVVIPTVSQTAQTKGVDFSIFALNTPSAAEAAASHWACLRD